jgi:hypothetical protein
MRDAHRIFESVPAVSMYPPFDADVIPHTCSVLRALTPLDPPARKPSSSSLANVSTPYIPPPARCDGGRITLVSTESFAAPTRREARRSFPQRSHTETSAPAVARATQGALLPLAPRRPWIGGGFAPVIAYIGEQDGWRHVSTFKWNRVSLICCSTQPVCQPKRMHMLRRYTTSNNWQAS